MKQIIQDLKIGNTKLVEVPVPVPADGEVLIETHKSLVSLGTERMLVDFGRANLINKARQQPDKVKMVLDKIKSDGISETLKSVKAKMDKPLPLGYSNVGTVVDVGKRVKTLKKGDRVVSNGFHAEYVSVPENLVAKIPDSVSSEDAVFTVIASIALQGIRLINPTFGEIVVVYGLGLIGLLAVKILLANGCKVIGIDIDHHKTDIAAGYGAKTILIDDDSDPITQIETLTGGVGADAVLITASAKTSEIISNSARFCRQRGRVVLVGVIGLDLNRSDFYEKEISFQVSCSYGPGRYDPDYEEKGNDYPIGFVRWTEKRNFEAILDFLNLEKISFADLISEKIPLNDCTKIYDNINSTKSIATILEYAQNGKTPEKIITYKKSFSKPKGDQIAIIGAGNFVNSTLLPSIESAKRNRIKYIVSNHGLNAGIIAKKFGIANASSDFEEILKDDEIGLVMIATRHQLHAQQTIMALEAGKSVFVEKPLTLNNDELNKIIDVYKKNSENGRNTSLTVGFNRRFSPYVQKIKSEIGNFAGPLAINATMNAGYIPGDSWVHDLEMGGGRIIGEACHYMDIAVFLTGSLISKVNMFGLGKNPDKSVDTVVISLYHENGSITSLNYFANGSKSYPKERVEVFVSDKTIILDNFKKIFFYGFKKKNVSGKQDKGHGNQFRLIFDNLLNGGNEIIPIIEIVNVSQASFAAIESLNRGEQVEIV